MSVTLQAELLLDARAQLGEGPLWDADRQVLWWIDVKGHQVHRFSPAEGSNHTLDVGQQVGTVVRRERGGLIVALHHGIASLDPDTGALEILCDPESHLADNRFNDGKVDPEGRFWVGTMEDAEENMDRGSLYSMEPDGKVERRVKGVGVSNGIVWTSDARTMYYIDSPTRKVDVFDYDRATGEIANRRVAVAIPDGMGYPDGMAIDSEDKLWVAMWAGRAVRRFDPETGELLATVEVPAENVSACAFGGPDLDELYITTARKGVDAEQLEREPTTGGLFRVRPGVRGTVLPGFAG